MVAPQVTSMTATAYTAALRWPFTHMNAARIVVSRIIGTVWKPSSTRRRKCRSHPASTAHSWAGAPPVVELGHRAPALDDRDREQPEQHEADSRPPELD